MKTVAIIGQGPAGVSASLYTTRAGIKTLLIGTGAGALTTADRIENYYGLESPISGPELIQRGIEQSRSLGAEIISEEVTGIGLNTSDTDASSLPSGFFVRTERAEYTCDAIILATGSSRVAPNIKGLKEFEGLGISYCAICDAFFYRGKSVAVLGNGEFALNEVKELLPVVESVTLLTNGESMAADFPTEVKIITSPIECFQSSVTPLFEGAKVPLDSVFFKDGTQISVSGVFIAYGSAGSSALARKIGAFTEGNKISVDSNMSTNIDGVFAAGDCTGGLLQIAKAVSDGAIAGTSAIKYLRGLR